MRGRGILQVMDNMDIAKLCVLEWVALFFFANGWPAAAGVLGK